MSNFPSLRRILLPLLHFIRDVSSSSLPCRGIALGTSVREIGLLCTVEQAFLLKHVGYEDNQQSSFCVCSPTTHLFSRRRGSIRAVCIFLDQAARLFSLT